jgi:hypothetical protein
MSDANTVSVKPYGYVNPKGCGHTSTIKPEAEGDYTQPVFTQADDTAAELARYKRLYDLELARAIKAEGEAMALTWAQVNCDEMRRQLSLLMEKARSILCSSQFDELDEYLEQLGGIDGAAKTSV